MTIRFRCSCGHKLRAPAKYAGKRANCTKCGKRIRIPGEKAPEPTKGDVVVADSNPRDRSLTAGMLEEYGFKVYTAENGDQAVELIRAAQPDICMLDLDTERLSAFQIISAIQDELNDKNRDVWRTPFIITGTDLSARDRGFAKALNVKHCYNKPLGASQVCKQVEQTIKNRHREVRKVE